jgi:hypothetical protein
MLRCDASFHRPVTIEHYQTMAAHCQRHTNAFLSANGQIALFPLAHFHQRLTACRCCVAIVRRQLYSAAPYCPASAIRQS